jgi:transcriptional regulator with XRE-family HTH domain
MTRHIDQNFGLRIKQIRNHLGLSQTKFGNLFDVSQAAVSIWERGGYPDSMVLVRIAKYGNTTLEWLLTGEKGSNVRENRVEKPPFKMNEPSLKEIEDYLPLPLLKDHVSCGPPKIIIQEDFLKFCWLPPLLWSENSYLIHVKNNSMEPILKKEDIVAIREWFNSTKALEGILTAVWLSESGITIGSLSSNRTHWVLEPQNHRYSSIFIKKRKGIRFFRVMWWCGFPSE